MATPSFICFPYSTGAKWHPRFSRCTMCYQNTHIIHNSLRASKAVPAHCKKLQTACCCPSDRQHFLGTWQASSDDVRLCTSMYCAVSVSNKKIKRERERGKKYKRSQLNKTEQAGTHKNKTSRKKIKTSQSSIVLTLAEQAG